MPDQVRRAFAQMFPPQRSRIQNPLRRRAVSMYDAAKAAVLDTPRITKSSFRASGERLGRQLQPGPRQESIRGMTPGERIDMEIAKAVAPGASPMDRLGLLDFILPGMTRWKQGIRAFHGGPAGFRHFDPIKEGMGAGGAFKGKAVYLTEAPPIGEGYMEMARAAGSPSVQVRTHNIPPQAKIFDSTKHGVSNKMWEDLKSAFKKRVMPEGEYRKDIEELVEQDLNAIGMDVHWMNEKGGGGASIDDVMYQLGQLHQDIWGPTGLYGEGHQEVWNLLQDIGYHGLKYKAGTQFGLPKGTKAPINYAIYDFDVINNPNKLMPKPKSRPDLSLNRLQERRRAYQLGIEPREAIERRLRQQGYAVGKGPTGG